MTTREKILEVLEKEKGTFVSGESLAERCGVSRNSVWKNVNELKKNGYGIASVSNRGYMLGEDSDLISKTGICMFLKKPCDKIFVFDELDSTNNEAKRKILFEGSRILYGTLIVAKTQTNGRGHCKKTFSSPEGGIYLSVILEPGTMKGGNSVAKHVLEAVLGVLQKFCPVNLEPREYSSVYSGKEKICGILTEGIVDLETGLYSNYIVGIGIRAEKLKKQNGALQKNELIASVFEELLRL